MSRDKIYDGRVLFEWWCRSGKDVTNSKLMAFAKSQFGTTSQMGPRYSMWAWAFDHPEEAYEMWREWKLACDPERPAPTFEAFLLLLRDMGSEKSITSKKNLMRFYAKYNLPMEFRVKPKDIVQVTSKDHPLFRRLMIVDQVFDAYVCAYYVDDEGMRAYHVLGRDIVGVCGKVIA